MPSVSRKQAALMRMEYARAKAGQETRTGMTLGQLAEWTAADAAKAKPKGKRRK